MPERLEKLLKAQAKRKGLKGKRANKYIYGTMREAGWKPSRDKNERTQKQENKTTGRIHESY